MDSHMWRAMYIPWTMATSRKPDHVTVVLCGKSIHILTMSPSPPL